MNELTGHSAVAMIGSNLAELRSKIVARMKVDLYFTLTTIFGLKLFDAPFHQNLCSFTWDEVTNPHQLLLAPRGSGKSSIGMVKAASKWLLNPDHRSLIVSYNLERCNELRRYLDETLLSRAPMLATLFPDQIAAFKAYTKPRKDPWVIPGYNLSGRKDGHFTFSSIESGVTGMHVDYIHADDLVDEVTSRSSAECQRALDWLDITINSTEHQINTPWTVIGTHYHLTDPYAAILTDAKYRHFRPFVHPGLLETFSEDGSRQLSSYWPSKFSVADLLEMRKRMGFANFAALIDQNPTQHEGSPFREANLRFCDWDNLGRSVKRDDGRVVHIRNMTIGSIWDPALGDDDAQRRQKHCDNAVVFGGMDSDGDIYVLDTWAQKCSPEKSISANIALAVRYEPDFMGCEEVLFSALLLPALTRHAHAAGIASYNVMPVKPRGRSKDLRILALQTFFDQRRIHIIRSNHRFTDELLTFPAGRSRDLLDAFAYLVESLYPPTGTVDFDVLALTPGLRAKATSITQQGADNVTGY